MNEYKLIVPVFGSINLTIYAENTEEAINILVSKQADLQMIPHGHIEMELSKILVIENEINESN
jgi:hypothetical protein